MHHSVWHAWWHVGGGNCLELLGVLRGALSSLVVLHSCVSVEHERAVSLGPKLLRFTNAPRPAARCPLTCPPAREPWANVAWVGALAWPSHGSRYHLRALKY